MMNPRFPPHFVYSRRFQVAIAIPLTVILCTFSAIARSQRMISTSITPSPTMISSTQSATHNLPIIDRIQLIAQDHRQNWGSGHGVRPQAAAMATLLLHIHNPQATPQTIILEQVTLKSQNAKTAELIHPLHQAIALQPLENTVQEIRVSIPQGLNAAKPLQAIVQYRVGQQTHDRASEFITVDRR
jgi:hypothetical protein